MKKNKSLPPAVVTMPEQLPLGDPNFSWQRFEAFCRDFISSLPKVKEVHHYGKSGNRQRGVDLIATLDNGQEWVFQCKQYKRFTPGQVNTTVSKTAYRANRYILLLACEATSEVRDEVKKHRNWSAWDVRDISIRIRKFSQDVARSLVETHFGAAWRTTFLGLSLSGAFVSADEFFRPLLNRHNLFNHSWLLVGRDRYSTEIRRFISSECERVLVLSGRGGIGKTKILHGLANGFDQIPDSGTLRFTVEGLSVTDEGLDTLPSGQCTIVVDDAYRREDLTALFALIRRRATPTKVILTIRPYASERVRSCNPP